MKELKEENQFVMYTNLRTTSTNLRTTSDHVVPGATVAWFSDQESAQDYLRQNKIEITDVYINKLDPIS